ncbi:hypothetical protein RND81_11G223500 [Saponaria officinalis]|uniref:Uncharacterized protein n=1 Tax=Saponaria officinalis TaxID=3572 RepID=A0AAW1HQ86_SAPOF
MAPLPHYYLRLKKVLLFTLFTSTLLSSFFFVFTNSQVESTLPHVLLGRRNLLSKNVEVENDFLGEVVPRKKKSIDSDNDALKGNKKSTSSSSSSKNQTKITKPKTSSLDTSLSTSSSKNKTKLTKPTSKKLVDSSSMANSTSKTSSKSVDLPKPTQSDKTDKKYSEQRSQNQDQKRKPPSSPTWISQVDEDEDLVSEFRNLPTKFHQTFIPDLHKISTTSKIYLTKYNKEITKGFKPYIGNKYAPSFATAISFLFIIIPFLLVSLIFTRIKSYFSLQKLIIFVQIYLSIYFSILCVSSLVTGLEPLKLFYATSEATYVWLQVLQTLAYVLFLLLLLMYLVLVFSTKSDLGQKLLGLAQTFVGFAIGLHYYMTVFHRVVLRQPPKSSWKIHGIYATCFLVICLFAGAERRKKVYLVEGGEEGKTS